MTKRILLTGAAGFIGFHLAKALAARQTYVIGLDQFNDYYDVRLKRARADELKQVKVEIVQGDVCDKELLHALVKEHRLTHVVHLAAQAGVRYSLEQPSAYVHANLLGFTEILELCRAFFLPLTYASSSSVYGLNGKIPFSENDPVDAQASFYGVTKRANELMASTYHHLFGIPSLGLRFFTVYGPWGRPDMAYFSFTEAIMQGKPIPVFNNGRMQRDFTYIDDIIQGTLAAIDHTVGCDVVNLGNHQPEELLTLIRLLEQGLGRRAVLDMKPMQQGDVYVTYADTEKASRLLGFKPVTPLEVGIPKFLDWYRNFSGKS